MAAGICSEQAGATPDPTRLLSSFCFAAKYQVRPLFAPSLWPELKPAATLALLWMRLKTKVFRSFVMTLATELWCVLLLSTVFEKLLFFYWRTPAPAPY